MLIISNLTCEALLDILGLTLREKDILSLIKEDSTVSRNLIAEKLGISSAYKLVIGVRIFS
jgi:DNA-binding CsgD family transcriptional regulator